MLTSGEAWHVLEEHAPRGSWIPLTELYRTIESHVQLDAADLAAMSAKNSSPRWKRAIRNVLQRKKARGAIEWDGKGLYRFP